MPFKSSKTLVTSASSASWGMTVMFCRLLVDLADDALHVALVGVL